MDKSKIRDYLLRGGVAFVFLSFGLWEIINPQYWISFIPFFLTQIVDSSTLVIIHGGFLTAIGVWIASGKQLKAASITAGAMLLGIIVELFITAGFSDIFVRDAAILVMIISLYFGDNSAKKR